MTASDVDRDGVGIAAGALTLNGGGIETSNVAVALGLGSHAIATAADHTVNDLRPAFGSTVANRHWIAGSAVSLQLPAASGGDATVSHALTGPGEATTLTLPQGLSWTAATRTISGTPGRVAAAASWSWTATDGDGDTAQLSFDITVAAANAPRPTSLALSAPTGFDGDYAAGEVIRAVVSFDRNVAVTGAPRLALDIGGVMRQAAYASGSSDADELSFHYTVTSSDFDGDGLDIGSDALTLNGGGIVDAGDASVAASLGLAGLAIGGPSGRTVRDTQPVFSQAASAADRSLAKDVQTSTTLPRATGDGALTYSISPALPAGLTLASARPTIAGTPTAAGATTHTLTVTDVDGDRATLGPFTVTVVDGAPVVSAVTIVSTPYANATYGLGEVIQILVDFDKQVRRSWLGGQAELEVDMGGTIRRFQYSGGYSGNNLLFERVVSAADRDADGIGIGSDALTLGTGTLTDLETGVAAVTVIGTHAVANAAAHKVDGSVNTPLAVKSVSIVSSPASSDGYDVGESIKVEIAFSKRVSVTGAPRLALTIGRTRGRRRSSGGRAITLSCSPGPLPRTTGTRTGSASRPAR